MVEFIFVLQHYLIEIIPVLLLGFFLSGLIYEFIPPAWIEKRLGEKRMSAIFYATITGTVLPICCWGALPVAVSFYKKGAKLGPILAFLVATPATSVSAVVVTYRLLGLRFTIFIFFAVVFIGMLIGIMGNQISFTPRKVIPEICPHCEEIAPHTHKRNLLEHMKSVFKFAFWNMPREIGLEIFLGIILAAIVATFVPIGLWIKQNLQGLYGYIFALIFGLVMYICSTAAVPLVDAFINQGLNIGAGMVLLLIGPITSYGTILVLRKEFGFKILLFYLGSISILSLLLGYIFSLL